MPDAGVPLGKGFERHGVRWLVELVELVEWLVEGQVGQVLKDPVHQSTAGIVNGRHRETRERGGPFRHDTVEAVVVVVVAHARDGGQEAPQKTPQRSFVQPALLAGVKRLKRQSQFRALGPTDKQRQGRRQLRHTRVPRVRPVGLEGKEDTRGHKRTQEDTRGHKRTQEDTRGHTKTHEDTRGHHNKGKEVNQFPCTVNRTTG
jgi:hypothetical protein